MRVQFYYDVVCPYAYLASTRVERVAARHGARVDWRPILLGGVFKAIGAPDRPAEAMSPPRARLNGLDLLRQADLAGVPLRFPATHPRRTVEAMRLIVGAPEDRRPALSHALFRAYWVDGDDVADREVLARIARAHQIDPEVGDRPEVKQALFDRTAEAVARGAFGVPTFAIEGQDRLWWGQDRLPFVERALAGHAAPGEQGSVRPAGDGTVIRFFHDFSSPFSYLASTQIERVAAAGGARVEWTPILLGALFRDIGTADVPLYAASEPKRRYYFRDLQDWSAWWGVPLRFPSAFPLRTVAPLRVALAEPATTAAIYRAAWADDRDVGDPATLRAVLDEAGFDGAALMARTEDPEIKARLRANTEAAKAAGACGVPTFEVRRPDGTTHLVWGQDRLDMVGHLLDGWRPACG
jgi:2-hydroxychromene-2-carboxylate isomerase